LTKDKRTRTLILSIVFSSFGPFVTGYALFLNTATTQFADFLRRTVELGVLILALWIYQVLKNNTNEQKKIRLGRQLYFFSGSVLIFSGVFLLLLFTRGIFNPSIPSGDVRLGLAVAGLGVFFNGYFFIRYTLFQKDSPHAVMDTQGKLYQAKTFVDVNVVVALASVMLFEASQTSYIIDQAGTLIVALYLLLRGVLLIVKEP